MGKFYTLNEYINQVKKFNGDRYTFEKTVYVNRSCDVIVTCAKHKIDIKSKAYTFNRKVKGKLPVIGSCPECIKEHHIGRRVRAVKKPKKKLLKILTQKYYPCHIHGNVLVGKKRCFNEGCPTCNIEKYSKTFASYEEAKARVNRMRINSGSEYYKWRKRTCQDDLPANPERTYKDKWVDWYMFLDIDKESKMSNGERRIYDYLKRKGIEYQWQKKFDDCKNMYRLPFDFYLPYYNVAIEFDGQQHFKVSNFSTDPNENIKKFNQIQKNDKIKTKYCKDNNITLIRLDDYHLENNIIEWELDVILTRIAAEIAISTI